MQKTAILWENNEFIHKHSFFFEKLEKLSTVIHTIFFFHNCIFLFFVWKNGEFLAAFLL